ncbi:hypothetical protein OSTOST_08097 [Ostertagia ostertagi]
MISMPFVLVEDAELDAEQRARLKEYANEILGTTLTDWKTFCEKTIKEPKIDPTYRRKPKKTAEERKAEAQLRMMNVELKKKKGQAKIAKLPEQYPELTPLMADKMNQLNLTKQQQDSFATITRTLDDDHNLLWSGDMHAGCNKIFIGSDQGRFFAAKCHRRLMNGLIIKRDKEDVEVRITCNDVIMLSSTLIRFQNTVVRRRVKWNRHILPTHRYQTEVVIYNGWIDDGFPKDLKALNSLISSIAADSRRSTILIGKSIDASCELFWMMILVVKAVMGKATAARLTSILEACINDQQLADRVPQGGNKSQCTTLWATIPESDVL